jgi:hypothetical protein
VVLTWKGETHNIEGWSKKLGIKYTTLRQRIAYGWSTEKVLTSHVRPWAPGKALSKE